MKSYLDTLRPFEKRVVFGVAALMFVVLNLWFVIPHFSDWGRVQARMGEARDTLAKFQRETAQASDYTIQIRKLESESPAVASEEQNIDFQRTVQTQATQTGVRILQNSPSKSVTNQFFVELSQTFSVESEEQQLVDFLYNLGSGNSLMRVRGLNLRPDGTRQKLSAGVTLVVSYQKKPAAKPAAAAGATASAKSSPPTARTASTVARP